MDDARAILSEVIRKDVTAPDTTSLTDLDGWDSLKAVRLILKLEEVIGRDLDENDIDGLRSIGDVSRLLRSDTSA